MNRTTTKVLVGLLVIVVGVALYMYVINLAGQRGSYGDDGPIRSINAGVVTNSIKSDNPVIVTGVVKDVVASGNKGTNTIVQKQGVQTNLEKSLDRLDELISDDDLNGAYRLARTLMKHSDVDVRQEVVDTFDWIGLKALPGLSAMLLDADPDVASSAQQGWESVISDMDDENLQAQILTAGIKVLKNQDDVESAILIFDSMESDVAVRSVVDIIQNGTPAASEIAREHYEFMTDEPFSTPEATEEWIAKELAEEAE